MIDMLTDESVMEELLNDPVSPFTEEELGIARKTLIRVFGLESEEQINSELINLFEENFGMGVYSTLRAIADAKGKRGMQEYKDLYDILKMCK